MEAASRSSISKGAAVAAPRDAWASAGLVALAFVAADLEVDVDLRKGAVTGELIGADRAFEALLARVLEVDAHGEGRGGGRLRVVHGPALFLELVAVEVEH